MSLAKAQLKVHSSLAQANMYRMSTVQNILNKDETNQKEPEVRGYEVENVALARLLGGMQEEIDLTEKDFLN